MVIVAGQRLGPYQIVASLGAGGMGEVYRTTDTKLGLDVASESDPPATRLDLRINKVRGGASAEAALGAAGVRHADARRTAAFDPTSSERRTMTKRWVVPVSMIALAALTVPAGAETPNGKDAKKNAVTAGTKGTASAAKQDEEAVWRLEQRYWEYVKQNDVSGYLTLWDERFVGWPGFSENPVEKSSIAEWISPLHTKPAESVDYTLTRKAVRSFGDVVVVHYLAHVFFRSSTTGEIIRERSVDRLTHTWRRHGDSWQIITGMSNTPVAAAGLR